MIRQRKITELWCSVCGHIWEDRTNSTMITGTCPACGRNEQGIETWKPEYNKITAGGGEV
jgi:rubrerythrin